MHKHILFILLMAMPLVSFSQENWGDNEMFQAYLMQSFFYDDLNIDEYYKGSGTFNMSYFSGDESDTLRLDFFSQRQPRRYFDYTISLTPELYAPESYDREKKFFYYKRGDVINRYIEHIGVNGTTEEYEELEDRINDDMCRYALDTNNYISFLTIIDDGKTSFYLASSKAVMLVEVNLDSSDRHFLKDRNIDINKEFKRVLDYFISSIDLVNVELNTIHQLVSLRSWERECRE
ncbi:MAG: hypothetical protein QNK23_16010 [Crocinitomicaceae bacterium]|nr:hypothetical protein [Crocinitomicaceae bacterium]